MMTKNGILSLENQCSLGLPTLLAQGERQTFNHSKDSYQSDITKSKLLHTDNNFVHCHSRDFLTELC